MQREEGKLLANVKTRYKNPHSDDDDLFNLEISFTDKIMSHEIMTITQQIYSETMIL